MLLSSVSESTVSWWWSKQSELSAWIEHCVFVILVGFRDYWLFSFTEDFSGKYYLLLYWKTLLLPLQVIENWYFYVIGSALLILGLLWYTYLPVYKGVYMGTCFKISSTNFISKYFIFIDEQMACSQIIIRLTKFSPKNDIVTFFYIYFYYEMRPRDHHVTST